MRTTQRCILTLAALSALVGLGAYAPSVADARCGPGRTFVWPDASTPLPPRPEIVVIGEGGRGEAVARIASRSPELVSRRGDRVPLAVVQLQQGDQRFTQAVLRAERDLRIGDEYRLRVDGRPVRDRAGTRGSWPIADRSSATSAWNAAPRVEAPVALAYGCGPAESIPVSVDVTAASLARYRVRVWRDGTTESSAQKFDFMPQDGGTGISLGHGMCSGPFDPPSGTLVHFRIAIVDPEGGEVPMPGPPLSAVFP